MYFTLSYGSMPRFLVEHNVLVDFGILWQCSYISQFKLKFRHHCHLCVRFPNHHSCCLNLDPRDGLHSWRMTIYFFQTVCKCLRCLIEDCLVCWSKMISFVRSEAGPRKVLSGLILNLKDTTSSGEVIHDLGCGTIDWADQVFVERVGFLGLVLSNSNASIHYSLTEISLHQSSSSWGFVSTASLSLQWFFLAVLV